MVSRSHEVPTSSLNAIPLEIISSNKQDEVQSSSYEFPPGILDRSSSRRLSTNTFALEDIPPNGGYGWVCTLCVFMINAHTFGVNSAWGIFLAEYLSNGTFPGATHLEYALIGGLSIAMGLLSSPLVNISIRKFGLQVTLLFGTFALSSSLIAASFTSQIWHLFLSQGLCFGLGMGFLYIPATAALPQWFSTKRSLAVGLASSGTGLGGLAYNLIAGRAIQTVGLEWTYRILAFCTLAVNFLASILLKDRDKHVKPQQVVFDYKEYRHIEVLLVIFWGALTDLGYIVLFYSLPSFALSVGLSQTQGSIIGAMLNLGLAVGRPIIGYFSDMLGRINIATLMTAFCGVLCLALWVPAKSFGLLILFAILCGTSCGIFWGTSVSVTAEVVGLKRLPNVFGMICVSLVIPTIFAEPIALEIVSASGGDYKISQIFVGIMFLLASLCILCLRSWKITDIEAKAIRERHDVGIGSALNGRKEFWLTPRKLFMLRRV